MNPYLTELRTSPATTHSETHAGWTIRPDSSGDQRKRRDFLHSYAWAIPNKEILTALTTRSPIIEIGAGNGYWTRCINENGGDSIAVDPGPTSPTWTTVHDDDHTIVTDHADRTLLLCWPAFSAEWPAETIQQYDGDTLVYIGEGRGGVTGSPRMHRVISQAFGTADRVIDIPQWASADDRAYIFTR